MVRLYRWVVAGAVVHVVEVPSAARNVVLPEHLFTDAAPRSVVSTLGR